MRHVRWYTLGLAVLLLALLTGPSLGASQESPSWTHFTMVDGLPSNTVWAIAADPGSGDVWLGTSAGASLYRDGRWTSYTSAHGLGDDWVSALAVDGEGRVWFGTFGGGLTLLEGERWQTYRAADSGLAGDFVSALAVGAEGELWCGTWGRGISLFEEGRWRRYDSANSRLPTDYVTALAVGAEGELWVGLHGQGVARLAGGRWSHIGSQQGLADDFVNALAVGADGELWVGTAKGLSRLDAAGQVVETYGVADGLPDERVQALAVDGDGRLWVGTANGAAVLEGGRWTAYGGQISAAPEEGGGGLAHGFVSAIASTPGGVWFGSYSAGATRYGEGSVASARRLPVVLVHGWHGPESDRLEDSEFRFLASWLRDDGYPVYYATGISPQNTLHKNAANLRETIERAKQETGAAQVEVIAFSMGGLNTRAYIESSLYGGDVDQAFILGTPQAGVRTWYPFLLRELHEWSRDPSIVELTPEYAALFNRLHQNSGVPYTLIAGDARGPELPETLRGLPPGDALISAGSALALEGEHVRKVLTDDLHAWSDETIVLGLPSLLWPRRTYDAHIRNRLRLGADTALPGVEEAEPEEIAVPTVPNHSPYYSGEVAPGETITQTVTVDTTGEVRFYLRGQTGPLTFRLIDPQGRQIDEENASERGEHFDLGLADFQSYLVRRAEPGEWQVVVGRPEDATGATRFTGYTVFASSDLELSVDASGATYGQGDAVPITASLRRRGEPVLGAELTVEIGRPDLQVDSLPLYDDGRHQDGAAGDGVYGGLYQPPALGGYYTVFATARGEPAGGRTYARTAETLFAVSAGTASLAGQYAEAAEDADRDGRYDWLALQVGIDVKVAGDYLLAAALVDGEGRELGRAVAPLALNAGQQAATLRFPGALIARSGVDGPYSVGRVTLLDEAGAAVVLEEAENVLQTRPYRYQDFEGP